MKYKIEKIIIILLILLLPFMMYINVAGTKVNISMGDCLLVLVGLLFFINIKEFFIERRWLYLLYFIGLIFSLSISQWISLYNKSFLHVGNSVMLMEMIKTLVVAAYFLSAFIFIRNEKGYRLAMNVVSLSSIPVMIIGFSSYFYFLDGKKFPLETFQISGNLRFLGTFEDPNLAALYFIFIFFISLNNFRFNNYRLIRGLMLGISSLSLIAIFLTISRGGMLALAIGIIVYVVWNWRLLTKNILFTVVPIIIFTLLSINIDFSFQDGKITNSIVDRIQTSLSSNLEEVDRVQLTKTAIEMGNDNFLWGVGKGSFPLNTYKYLGEDSPIYINQYIPHSTLVGYYAQQGIFGLLIFMSLPSYILYRMVRSKKGQYYSIIPLFIATVVHSMTINIENVRFLWLFLGLVVAGEMRGIALEPVSLAKTTTRKTYALVFVSLLILMVFLFVDVSRKMATNIYVYNGDVYEKKVKVMEPGDYLLSFDVQTDTNRHQINIYDGETLIETRKFEAAQGLVQLPVHIENEAKIIFQSNEVGWMRINNAYLTGDNGKIPLYNYILLPSEAEGWFNQKNWLQYLDMSSFKKELLVSKNELDSINILDAKIIRYGNLTHVFEFDMNREQMIQKDYQLRLLLDYASITDQLPAEPQINHIIHGFGLYPSTSNWTEGVTYTVKSSRLISSNQFALYGGYIESANQIHLQESYFPIEYELVKQQQDILPIGESHWINVNYSMDQEGQINFTYNGWVETGRMNLEPGSYEIKFKAQGTFYEEFSNLRLRDSSLETIAEVTLDDTMREYTIEYDTDEYQEGISFVLELYNYLAEDGVGRRRVVLEDWLSVEKIDD